MASTPTTSTRDRIIAATNELFRRQGYSATSLSQISEAAGATIGSIYHFFPGGKEALGVAVVETTGAVYRELFEAILADAPDPVDGFAVFVRAAADTLAESGYVDPCPIGTVARETANTSEPLRGAADRVFTTWIDAARRQLEAAGLTPDAAQELALLFVVIVEGAFVVSRTRRDTDALQAAARHVTALIHNARSRVDDRPPSLIDRRSTVEER